MIELRTRTRARRLADPLPAQLSLFTPTATAPPTFASPATSTPPAADWQPGPADVLPALIPPPLARMWRTCARWRMIGDPRGDDLAAALWRIETGWGAAR